MTKKSSNIKIRLWISYILKGIVVLMFLLGAVNNLLQTEAAVSAAGELGYPQETVLYLGIILLISTLLYAIPRTSFFGATLLTGWLGGAVATHVIHEDPLFNILLPVIFGIVIWSSLLLGDSRYKPLFT